MLIKKYRAKNMQEALTMVRRDFGPNAILMGSREIRKPCFFGLTYHRYVEVTATNELDVPSQLTPRETPSVAAPPKTTVVEKTTEKPDDAGCDLAHFASSNLNEYRAPHLFPKNDFFNSIPSIPRGSAREPLRESPFEGVTPEEMDVPVQIQDLLSRIFAFLCDLDMDETSARSLVTALKKDVFRWFEEHHTFAGMDAAQLREKLYAHVQAALRTTGPLSVNPRNRKIVALVGPTGVGKTTTIAKLAAHYGLRENRRVGLITLDTFRMAAVEQLQTYANVIGVPMYVASSPRQIREAVDRMADFDLVLIDTAGRSQKEPLQIQEMRTMLEEAGTDEVHLVLSSASRPRLLVRMAETFAPLGTTALIITKLDESLGLGNLYPLVKQCGLPISYVTNGQNVPDDFQSATVESLTGWILGEESADEKSALHETQYDKAA